MTEEAERRFLEVGSSALAGGVWASVFSAEVLYGASLYCSIINKHQILSD